MKDIGPTIIIESVANGWFVRRKSHGDYIDCSPMFVAEHPATLHKLIDEWIEKKDCKC